MNSIDVLEKRVSVIERNQSKLAILQQKLNDGQITIVEILNDFVGGIHQEMLESTGLQIGALKTELENTIDSKTTGIQIDVEEIKNTIKTDTINKNQESQIERERRKRVVHLLGGAKTNKYSLFGSMYFEYAGKAIKNQFKKEEKPLLTFGDILKTEFDDVISYVRGWTPTREEKIKIEGTVQNEMLDLKDSNEVLKEKIDGGKCKRSEEAVLAVEISKNEQKLKKYYKYMSQITKELERTNDTYAV